MKQLLVIGKIWPEPKSTGAGWRMMQLLQTFIDVGFNISFGSASAKTPFSEDLEALNITEVDIKLNDQSFDEQIKNLQPDFVLFDRFMTEEQFGWRVSKHCPNAIKILDTEDLHCLRQARQEAFKAGKKFQIKDLYSNVAKREIASILRCDLSFIISEAEMNILTEAFKVDLALLHYLPFILNPISKTEIKELPSFENRNHFVMLGNWLHQPNFDSVKFVKQNVWPLIRKELKAAEIYVYGAYTSDKVRQFHKPKDGFYIMGRAESSENIYQNAKVLLSPIPYGAGLKTKFIHAMQQGLPSVTTTIGAEGICGSLPFAGEIVNTPQNIAKEAIKLYSVQKQWQKAQQNGFEIINSRFSKLLFINEFKLKTEFLQNNLAIHRQQNFVGQILQHHTMQSTKYLSKWIEEKNSK